MKAVLALLVFVGMAAPALADPHEDSGIRRKDYDRHEDRDVMKQGRARDAGGEAGDARAEYAPAGRAVPAR
ncbi:hypothetical protein [Lichenibacterium minor]|uniref:hypothetical protein n=1 Tax=Lichenibacterium minor TaxID=2316528 RepID=UPI0013EA5A1A|nr:hypothetical protein [Lichenibacterium minor]